MRFGRRKSGVAEELSQDDPEPRQRNRLSKPLTNKLSATISTTSVQEAVIHNKNASTREAVIGGPLTSHPSNPALRRQIRSQLFDEEKSSPNRSLNSDSSWSVAYMVGEIDKNSAQCGSPHEQQRPNSPVKPKKRKSFGLRPLSTRRSTSLCRSGSNQQNDPPIADSNTPTSSFDRIVDTPAAPPTRRASFTPGTATRKPSAAVPTQEAVEEHAAEDSKQDNLVETDGDPNWQPPPPRMAGRAETPADLDYSQLGVLRLGSLQIVNGRASPAISEMSKLSKQILGVSQPQRDVSSDYGEAEEDFHELITPRGRSSSRTTPNESSELRTSSWESSGRRSPEPHPLQNVVSLLHEVNIYKEEDQTSLIAKEYMAELPASPFAKKESSSPSRSLRRSSSEGSLHKSSSYSSLQRSPLLDAGTKSYSPLPPEQSPSPAGSVICRSRKGTEGFQSLEGLSGNGNDGEYPPCESVMSWYSPVQPNFPNFHRQEVFQSALEFQAEPCQAPPVSQTYLLPPHPIQKSDSGYSSTSSLQSLKRAESPTFTGVQPSYNDSATQLDANPQQSECGRTAPTLKSRKTEPAPLTPANIRPAVVSANSAPVIPTPDGAGVKQVKNRKKLQKKRPQSQPPKKISLSRVHSFEGDFIPRVPSEAEENLRIRSREVPELEKTYFSLDGLHHHGSLSSLNLQAMEVRFPSPGPEQTIQVRRSRSRSRPRSWISRSKDEGKDARRNSGISPAETMALVHEFGAAYSLGGGPYDLAHENIVYGHPAGHYDTPTVAPRPRPMMDDKAAADFARRRSRSIQDRDNMVAGRKHGFNDRGGIPGKNLRPASFASDAPPITPEMLQKAYRTSSEQRQASIGGGFAPPPPPHSPRPTYVDYEDAYLDGLIAPPPPSHSPRPVDIAPDPWAAPSAAWQARRHSARNLGSGQYWDVETHEAYRPAVEYEPLYPDIPPRGRRQGWPRHPPSQTYYLSEQGYCNGYDSRAQYEHQDFSPYEDSYGYTDQQQSRYLQHSRQTSVLQEIQQPRGYAVRSRNPSQHRPLPSPRTSGIASPRPHPQAGSVRSFASSFAEDLHPGDLERPCLAPDFERYSGGLGFEYERENGFAGSAGTRSVSGKAEAMRKGVGLSASFGVDLSDVPVMMAVVRR